MANRIYQQTKNTNTVFGGTDGIVLPTGTGNATYSAGTPQNQRPTSAVVGTLRYNTDIGLMEQYNAAGWQGVDSPPTITNIAGTINQNQDSTVTINGSNFKSASTINVEGNGVGGVARAVSTTYVSSSQLTFTTNASAVNYTAGQSFNIRVTNPSGLSAVLQPAGYIDQVPVWSTGAGSLGTVNDASRVGASFTVVATDPDSTAITSYTVTSGALPTGMSLGSGTGVINGTPNAVSSQTTYTFAITAASNSFNSLARTFTITINAPVITFNVSNSQSLGTLYDAGRAASSLTAISASISTGTISSISVTTGSVPAGTTLSSSGTWSGTANAVGSDTTSTFTVTASGTSGSATVTNTATNLTVIVKAPIVTSFTSVGTTSFSVPTGVSAVRVLVVAGGGGGGDNVGGGGGGGGVVEAPAYPVSPGGSVPITIGGGGASGNKAGRNNGGGQGSNSVFGNITANGGGGGGGFEGGGGGNGSQGQPGGSGGGVGWNAPVGSATQSPQPGGGTGYGQPGGSPGPQWSSGGGGGAGGTGRTATGATNGSSGGGVGYNSTITGGPVYYAGGGGGCMQDSTPSPGGTGGGGYGGQTSPGLQAGPGTNGLGGGAGGNRDIGPRDMVGGSGIVIVRY
jgi:hypothetical protein